MATNARDVKLNIAVGTTGAESVTDLADDLTGVAAAGKAAAPGVEKLAAELAALEAKTKELRATEAAARAEVVQQKTARDEQRDALARLRAESDKAVKATDEYKAAEKQLRLAIIDSRAAIRDKQAALDQASTSARVSAATEKNLADQIKASRVTAQAQVKQLEGDVSSLGATGTGVSSILQRIAPLMATAFSAQQFIGTITAAESLSRSYEQVFGSTEKARQEMEFIKGTANRLGLETIDLAKSYQSLAASTKGTVLEGQATRDVFEAVSRAMSTLGKSTSETERALQAVAQMASKGTVSMEELRGQLGEALPGAMKAAADGAGLTVEQLIEMVSTGSVLAKDILPALTTGLNDLYGKAAPPDTVIAEWARLKNQITETSMTIGEGGASKGLASLLTSATAGFGKFIAVTDNLGHSLGGVAFETVQAAKSSADFYQNLLGLDTAASKVSISSDKAAAAQAALANAQAAAGQSAQESIRQQELLAQKLEGSGESALKVRQRYLELAKGSADYVAQVDKEVAARTAESAVLTQLVNVYGTETEKRQVAVGVAREQAAISEKLASARNTEAIIATSYVLKLQEQAKATGDVTEATRKQIEEAQKSAAAKQTEFERTDALAKAKRIEAEATKAQSQSLQDNSARVGEYASAVQAATTKLERLNEAHKNGKATEKEVTDARAKLASATLLYRDALADATKAAELNIIQQQRAGQMGQAAVSLDLERAKAAQEVATAQGDSAKATQAATQTTELQVQASRAAADASRSEAEAIRQSAGAREAELKGRGELTAVAKDEIAARRQTADLKDIEAQKSDILTNKIYALAQANKSETATLEAKNVALERTITAQEKANALAERAIDLENKRLNRDKAGFSLNTEGQRVNMAVETKSSIYEKAKSQGLSEEQALKLSNETALPYKGPGLKVPSGFDTGENWGTRLQAEIDKLKLDNAARGTGNTAPTQTVNINIGGRTTAVRVASQTDASALTSVLRQLNQRLERLHKWVT